MKIHVGDNVKINAALIEERHAVTLYNTIKFLKENTNKVFTVTGRHEKGNNVTCTINMNDPYGMLCHLYDEDELILIEKTTSKNNHKKEAM